MGREMRRQERATVTSIDDARPAPSGVITLTEADSARLRDVTRRLADVQADAQLAADRAKVAIHEAAVEQQRLVRQLADTYGFSESVPYEHDPMARTLTRTPAPPAS
jgi:hypothetical protein